MISKIEDKIDILRDITLPDNARHYDFKAYKEYKDNLLSLKKTLNGKKLSIEDKHELLASVGQHNPELYNMIQSLKKGNKVERKIEKYQEAGKIIQGDASTSAEGSTNTDGTNPNSSVTNTDPIRFDYSDMYDFGMDWGYAPVMKNHSIKFDPEAAFNAEYFANQLASVGKTAE
jgi:hypothetical protein